MNQTTLSIEGMSCKSCVRHVSATLETVEGVEDVRVSLSGRSAVIVHDPTVPVAALVASLRAAGYPSHEMEPAPKRTLP